MKNILITGGAGFIGSHLVKRFVKNYPNYNIYNVDSLTYAGDLDNLKEIENKKNYNFFKIDINNHDEIINLFKSEDISESKKIEPGFKIYHYKFQYLHQNINLTESDLIVEVFGDRGKHTRAAVGMGSLPSNIAVEIDMILEVMD